MVSHVILKHAVPNKDSCFECDICSKEFRNRDSLFEHWKKAHEERGEKSNEGGTNNEYVNNEYASLKKNFDRLNALYQESKLEVEKVKAEYKVKLDEALDNFRRVTTENEELKERVDVLFKLGREYINKYDKDSDQTSRPPVDETTVGGNENQEQGNDRTQGWGRQKYRGFIQINSNESRRNLGPINGTGSNISQSKEIRGDLRKENSDFSSVENSQRKEASDYSESRYRFSGEEELGRRNNVQYCHFFTNYGRCQFEDKTGRKCRYEHSVAPLCQSGIACNRPKCMYTHPNISGRQTSFLNTGYPNSMGSYPMMNMNMINPWSVTGINQQSQQMISPFMHQMNGLQRQN